MNGPLASIDAVVLYPPTPEAAQYIRGDEYAQVSLAEMLLAIFRRWPRMN